MAVRPGRVELPAHKQDLPIPQIASGVTEPLSVVAEAGPTTAHVLVGTRSVWHGLKRSPDSVSKWSWLSGGAVEKLESGKRIRTYRGGIWGSLARFMETALDKCDQLNSSRKAWEHGKCCVSVGLE